MLSYAILLLIAVRLNATEWRSHMLVRVVGISVFLPVSGHFFYAICIASELTVALCAGMLQVRASGPIILLCLVMCIFHALGYHFNGYPPESPYHILVKIAEHAELIACILFSKPFFGRLKNATA